MKVQEGKYGVPQVVSYIGYPGLSKRGISQEGQPGSLPSCLAGDQSGHSPQHVYLSWMSLKWVPQ